MRQLPIAISLAVVLFLSLSAAAFADDRVVASVNGAPITARELEEAVDQLIPRSTFHGNVTEEKRGEFRDRALDELIVRELQQQDARAKGMKPDKQAVKRDMEKVRERFTSRSEYKKALEQAGMNEDKLRSRFEKESLIRAVTASTVTEPSRMTDAALKEYFDKNSAKFKQPESVRLRIISVRDEKKAMDIVARVQAGEDFGTLAAKMSEDDYRIKGGDIGRIHRGRIFPALEDAAFRLKQGETSGPILTEGVWFVVKVEEKQDERQLTFEEAKDRLRQDLEKKRAAELKEQWIAELRAKAKIEVKQVPGDDVGNKK